MSPNADQTNLLPATFAPVVTPIAQLVPMQTQTDALLAISAPTSTMGHAQLAMPISTSMPRTLAKVATPTAKLATQVFLQTACLALPASSYWAQVVSPALPLDSMAPMEFARLAPTSAPLAPLQPPASLATTITT